MDKYMEEAWELEKNSNALFSKQTNKQTNEQTTSVVLLFSTQFILF